jgi:hypothetical protein
VVYREEVIRLRYLPLKDASATEAMSVSGSESPNTLNNVPVADLSLENAKILETLFSRSWNNDERKPTKVQFNVRGLRIEGVTGADSRLKTITLFFSTDSAALTGLEIQRFAAKLQTLLKGQ